MIQIIAAIFEGGVFKPDQQPAIAEKTRVRLVVENLNDAAEDTRRREAWASLEQIWQESTFNSHGDRLSREQLHERR